MSRVAHPNVVSLLAARVLPPGAPLQHNYCVLKYTVDAIRTAICSLLHASYPKALLKYLIHKHFICCMPATHAMSTATRCKRVVQITCL